MLCTVQQARDAGTTGTDPEVTAWITAATVRIGRYTQQLFEPTTVAVVADVAPGGLVLLPRRVRTVTSVTLFPGGPVLPPAAYRVTSSATLGAVDAIHIRYGGWNDLVVGAESYSGGWANLFDGYDQVEALIEAGYDESPMVVSQGCALLAADMQTRARPSDADAAAGDDGLDVDDEGNNVRIETDDDASETAVTPSSSTGSTAVDALLAPYINAGARPVVQGV